MIKKILLLCILVGIILPIGFSKNCGGEISCECGDTLTSSYIMKKDLSCDGNALILKNSLNCNNFSIKGNNFGTGISIIGMDKKKISNCRIENFDKGIILSDIGFNDKSELNIITDSYFRNNTIWHYSYNGVTYNLSSMLDLNWEKNIIFNISKDNVKINFTKQNTLVGEYIFFLQADDSAEFFIDNICLLYTSPSPRDGLLSRMPSSA